VIFAILLAAAAPVVAPGADYLAGIRAGKLLCVTADPIRKTCSNIDSFVLAADGTLTETSEMLLTSEPLVTLETSSIGHIEGATNCGIAELADLRKGRVRVNGELLPPDSNALAIGKIVEKMGLLAGHKVCETLHVDGGKLTQSGTVEGFDTKLPVEPAAWIAPDEGYKVAAAAPIPVRAPGQ